MTKSRRTHQRRAARDTDTTQYHSRATEWYRCRAVSTPVPEEFVHRRLSAERCVRTAYFQQDTMQIDGVTSKDSSGGPPTPRRSVREGGGGSGGGLAGMVVPPTPSSSAGGFFASSSGSPASPITAAPVFGYHGNSQSVISPGFAAAGRASTTGSVDPPRPARAGCEWVWFPEGYWAERDIRRCSGSGGAGSGATDGGARMPWKWRSRSTKSVANAAGACAGTATVGAVGSTPDASPDRGGSAAAAGTDPFVQVASGGPAALFGDTGPLSPFLSEQAHVESLQNPRPKTTSAAAEPTGSESGWSSATAAAATPTPQVVVSRSSLGSEGRHSPGAPRSVDLPAKPQHGVICGLKRGEWKEGLRFSRKSKKHRAVMPAIAQAMETPVSAPEGYLSASDFKSSGSRQGTWTKEDGRLSRKLFGRAPWHRRESLQSADSATSSVRELLRGKTPPSTPQPHAPEFDWTSPYPAGEATRVKTPPLKEETASGRPRGVFFDLSGPDERSASASASTLARSAAGDAQRLAASPGDGSTSTSHASPRNTSSGQSRGKSPARREWWEGPAGGLAERGHKLGAASSLLKPGRWTPPRVVARAAARFDFEVPEHLPSSPLCPANSRSAKSKGRGMCVYHGRGHEKRHSPRGDRDPAGDQAGGGGSGSGQGGSGRVDADRLELLPKSSSDPV